MRGFKGDFVLKIISFSQCMCVMKIPTKTNLRIATIVDGVIDGFISVSTDPYDYFYVSIEHGGNTKIINKRYGLKADDIDDDEGFYAAVRSHVEQCVIRNFEGCNHVKKLMFFLRGSYLISNIKAAQGLGAKAVAQNVLEIIR